MKTIIKTDKAPAPIGPYSQAVVVQGQLLFTAGQIALHPITGQVVGATAAEQTEQVCQNLKAIVEFGHSDFKHVVKTTVFLKDMNDFGEMNKVYSKYFSVSAPARSTVQVAKLPKDVLVEIEVVALVI